MVRYESLFLACLLGSATAVEQSLHSDNGRLNCGIFGSGDQQAAENMYGDLKFHGLKDKVYPIAPGACNRVHCWGTSAIYVCNDSPKEVKLKGEWIAKGVKCVLENCCTKIMTGATYHHGISGQYFINGMGQNMNINIGYGNCNDPPSIRPSNAGGWNINGVCGGGVLNPASVNCEV